MKKNINELNNKFNNLNKAKLVLIDRRDEPVINLLALKASRKPKYYKIGKYAKVEKMTSDDYANIYKFPKGTIFYYQYPENGIKLDI